MAGQASPKARLYLVVFGLLLAFTLPACGTRPDIAPTRVVTVSTTPTTAAATQQTPAAPTRPPQTPQHVLTATPTNSPPAPTPTRVKTATPTPTVTPPPTATPAPTSTATAAPAATSTPAPPRSVSLRNRICAGVAKGGFTDYPWDDGVPGWYLDWQVHATPVNIPGTEHAQMVRLTGDTFYPDMAALRAAAQTSPGALWLIGNEPDVAWQDNVLPAVYAATYHDVYTAIKETDPTAQVAIGAISQVSPLRLRYLEQILAAYAAQVGTIMPVDVWNVHVFVLREEKDSWGVGLPPGMEDATDGTLWNLEDHARVDLVAEQVQTFRRWMAAHDQRNKPLIISEYGILMPADYGFEPAVVTDFLTGTFDYFATARDGGLGYPADDNRLVQRWCWYSAADTLFPTGNLFSVDSRQPTHLWPTFAAYLR